MTLDIVNRHTDKVAMANCAQLVNCLNFLFRAHNDFTHADRVKPAPFRIRQTDGLLTVEIPAASLFRIDIELS